MPDPLRAIGGLALACIAARPVFADDQVEPPPDSSSRAVVPQSQDVAADDPNNWSEVE